MNRLGLYFPAREHYDDDRLRDIRDRIHRERFEEYQRQEDEKAGRVFRPGRA